MKWNFSKIINKKYLLLLSILLGFSSVSWSQIRIIHSPIFFAKANTAIEISVRVDGGVTAADEMRIYFRIQNEESYEYLVMENFGDEFRGSLPAQTQEVGQIEYFLSLVQGGNVHTLPEANPYYEPFEIQITPGEARQEIAPPLQPILSQPAADQLALIEEKYLILTPENGERVEMEDLVIAVSIFFEPGEIDLLKTRLLIDGVLVQPELSENLITYVPPRVSEGQHEIDLYFVHPDGKDYQPVRWRFQAVSAARGGMRTLPLIANASGNIYTETRSDKYSGNRLDYSLIGGQFRGRQGSVRYGTRFYVTSLEDKGFQPRNRFLVWVDTKLLDIYAGDTSPRLSELMLWGKRVRGVNAQLNLKFINFDFVMGQTYRPVNATLIRDFVFDPITGDTVKTNTGAYLKQDRVSRYGTFKQNLLALKTTFGSVTGSHVGISVVKVKDDINSVQNGLKPKDNVVVGSDLQFFFLNNRLRWKSEIALSLLTDDISSGALSKADIDSLTGEDIPFDPADYEKYLTWNTSTIPIDPTTWSSLAFTHTFNLRFFRNSFTLKYKSIGSAYNSLGNPFIRKNLKGLFINDRVRLWQNRVYLTLGYEKYEDNFKQDDGNPILDLETKQFGLNFFPGPGLPNLNLNYRSYQRDNGVVNFAPTDPVDDREDNTTNQLTFNMSYDVDVFNLKHNISLNYITLDKSDAFSGNRPAAILPLGINNDIQSFSIQTRFNIPLRTTISYTNNDNSFLGGMNLFKFSSFNFRGDYRMFQDKLSLYSGFRRFSASGGTTSSFPGGSAFVIDYSKTQFDLGGRLTINRRHNFIIDLSTIDFADNGSSTLTFDDPITGLPTQTVTLNPSFKDYLIRFRYEMQF